MLRALDLEKAIASEADFTIQSRIGSSILTVEEFDVTMKLPLSLLEYRLEKIRFLGGSKDGSYWLQWEFFDVDVTTIGGKLAIVPSSVSALECQREHSPFLTRMLEVALENNPDTYLSFTSRIRHGGLAPCRQASLHGYSSRTYRPFRPDLSLEMLN